MTESVRSKAIRKTGLIGLAVNTALAGIKFVIGLGSNSVTIMADAVNNLMDGISSVIAIVSEVLSKRPPDPKHPHGYGRVEYIAALAVSVLLIIAGWDLFRASVLRILKPADIILDTRSAVILGISVVLKSGLAWYQLTQGRKWNNSILTAAGSEARVDVLKSAAAIVCSLLSGMTGLNLDAWAGAVFSIMLLSSGWKTLMEAMDALIGTKEESSLSQEILTHLKSPEVIDVYDLVLHSYGPLNQVGTVKIQLKESVTIKEADDLIFELREKVRKATGVDLLIQVRSAGPMDMEHLLVRKNCCRAAMSVKGTKAIHAFCWEKEENEISFDATVDYSVSDYDSYRSEVCRKIKEIYPDARVSIDVNIVRQK